MGRGLGPTQLAALTALADRDALAIDELADELGLADRRCRAVVDSLVERQLAHKWRTGWVADGKPWHRTFVALGPAPWDSLTLEDVQ